MEPVPSSVGVMVPISRRSGIGDVGGRAARKADLRESTSGACSRSAGVRAATEDVIVMVFPEAVESELVTTPMTRPMTATQTTPRVAARIRNFCFCVNRLGVDLANTKSSISSSNVVVVGFFLVFVGLRPAPGEGTLYCMM